VGVVASTNYEQLTKAPDVVLRRYTTKSMFMSCVNHKAIFKILFRQTLFQYWIFKQLILSKNLKLARWCWGECLDIDYGDKIEELELVLRFVLWYCTSIIHGSTYTDTFVAECMNIKPKSKALRLMAIIKPTDELFKKCNVSQSRIDSYKPHFFPMNSKLEGCEL